MLGGRRRAGAYLGPEGVVADVLQVDDDVPVGAEHGRLQGFGRHLNRNATVIGIVSERHELRNLNTAKMVIKKSSPKKEHLPEYSIKNIKLKYEMKNKVTKILKRRNKND